MADKTCELDKSYNGEGDEKGNKSILIKSLLSINK